MARTPDGPLKRSKYVSVRVDDIEKRIVERRLAAHAARNESDYIRRLIREDGARHPERIAPSARADT